MYILLAAIFLIAASVAHAKPLGPFSSTSGEFPAEAPASGALADIVATMSSGEWKKIPGSEFADAMLTTAEYNAIIAAALVANPGLTETNVSFWGTQGPGAVLEAWNSAAYDPVGRRWFFMGGGHGDYGGNEVYEYDFDTLQWTRLIDPEALTVQQTATNNFWVPAIGPISSHTYDGLVWNPASGSMWYTTTLTGFSSAGAVNFPEKVAVWEFDPDNPGWTEHPSTYNAGIGETVYLPSSQQVLSSVPITTSFQQVFLYDINGNETQVTYQPDGSVNVPLGGSDSANMFRIPDTASPSLAGRLFVAHDARINEYFIDEVANTVSITTFVGTPPENLDPYLGDDRQSGYAFNAVDEKVYIWGGTRYVVSWDPLTDTWEILANAASPVAPAGVSLGKGKVFDKWIYLEAEGVFAGLYDRGDDGIWLWKP